MQRTTTIFGFFVLILVTHPFTTDGLSDDPGEVTVELLPAIAAPLPDVQPQLDVDKPFIDSLLEKRTRYATQYGSKHPVVLSLDAEIKAVKAELKSNAIVVANNPLRKLRENEIDSMSDQELRSTVKLLVNRLLELETEVQLLKHPKPKHYLLR